MPSPKITHLSLKQLGDLIPEDWAGGGLIRVRHMKRGWYADTSGDAKFDDLRKSIETEGIQQPLYVDGKFLVDGHHRAIIAHELGLKNVPITRDWQNT